MDPYVYTDKLPPVYEAEIRAALITPGLGESVADDHQTSVPQDAEELRVIEQCALRIMAAVKPMLDLPVATTQDLEAYYAPNNAEQVQAQMQEHWSRIVKERTLKAEQEEPDVKVAATSKMRSKGGASMGTAKRRSGGRRSSILYFRGLPSNDKLIVPIVPQVSSLDMEASSSSVRIGKKRKVDRKNTVGE